VGSPEGTVLRIEGRSIRVRLDERTLKAIAEETEADYYKADSETDLREIYEKLSTELILKPEETELTAGATGVATLLFLIAAGLSLLWFNQLP
jgi:Ca-activated chloride channel family protein